MLKDRRSAQEDGWLRLKAGRSVAEELVSGAVAVALEMIEVGFEGV